MGNHTSTYNLAKNLLNDVILGAKKKDFIFLVNIN